MDSYPSESSNQNKLFLPQVVFSGGALSRPQKSDSPSSESISSHLLTFQPPQGGLCLPGLGTWLHKATANGFFNHCVLPVRWTEHFLPHSYVVSTVTEATISPLSKLMAQGSALSIPSIHLSVSSLPHRLSLSPRVGHFGEILCPFSLFIL